jgi:hypothetical protein
LTWLTIGACCLGLTFSSKSDPSTATSVAAFGTDSGGTTPAAPRYITQKIQDLPVVTWVLADNPETEGNEGFDYSQLDPADLRVLRVRMVKPDSGLLHIQMLQSLHWIEDENAQPGESVFLEYEELGISGDGEVLEILPCPPIPPRPSPNHCLVTTKFEHEAANVVDLYIEGLAEPIGVTTNHPFWSEDRQEFVQARELRIGETLVTASGCQTRVQSMVARATPEAVYNLEVDGEHVYYVSAGGVLVHNAKGYHGYAIFNNKTGEIMKFGVSKGKISDVTGLSYRAQSQLSKIATAEGVARADLSTVVVRNFANKADMFKWERQTVGFFRGNLGAGVHPLKHNLLPLRGDPF